MVVLIAYQFDKLFETLNDRVQGEEETMQLSLNLTRSLIALK